MQRLAVLGSNAFSGQDLVDAALRHTDAEVLGISRSPERPDWMLAYSDAPGRDRFRFLQADLNHDTARIMAALDEFQPTHVINFAAQSEVGPSWAHPEDWFETNTVGLARLLKPLSGAPYLERYVHISSPEVYGTTEGDVFEDAPLDPSTPYAASKAAADLLVGAYAKTLGFPALWVRATNVYGPRQQLFKIIPRAAIYCRSGRTIELHGGGHAVKSFIHIRDVSLGELDILQRGTVGETYHLSPDRGHAVRDVVRRVCQASGVAFEDAVRTVEERPGQDAAYVIRSDKARSRFGWTPTVPIEEGVQEVVDWVAANWDHIARTPLEYQHVP